MKALNKQYMLAAFLIASLSACDGDDDYSPAKDDGINTAPTHGGNISKSFHEKDEFEFIYLLGTTEGAQSGENIAIDTDGDVLTVQNLTADVQDLTGFEISNNRIGIRPQALAPSLDTDQSLTVNFSFDISDGQESVVRELTVTITGEDAPPVVDGDLVGNFTKDVDQASLDLLSGVSDADDEELIASDVVADANNPFELPVTIADNLLQIDIAAVESHVPDGQKVTFYFSYTIKDHRYEIARNLAINVLGVKDVPEAPLVSNYFKSAILNETDAVLTIDLADEIIEREGDAIVISEVMFAGEGLPYGYSLDGNLLMIDPHAYFNEVPADGFITHNLTYKVADVHGNMSDGTPELSVVINGEQTNIISGVMSNPDFEDESMIGDIIADVNMGGFSGFGWATWWCTTPTIGVEYARTGSYGLRFEGRYCDLLINNIIADLPNDQKYAFSYGLLNKLESVDPVSTPYVPIFASVLPEGSTLDNRYWAGPRHPDLSIDKWNEHVQIVSTVDGGNWDGYEGSTLSWDIMKYGDADGLHYIDDFSVVAFGHYDAVAHDMLVDHAGTFTSGETITSSGGIVEVQTIEDENKLFVDTTDEASGVTISLPVKAGAIKSGGRFAVIMDAQLINHDDLFGVDTNTAVNFSVSLSNGTESITASLDGTTRGVAVSASDIIISEDFGRSADHDWSTESMILNIHLSQTNAQYFLDNIRLIAIP